MFKTFCNSGTIVRGFCSQAHTHQVDLGTRRCLVNVKIVACWKKTALENGIQWREAWEAMPIITISLWLWVFFKGLRAFLSKKWLSNLHCLMLTMIYNLIWHDISSQNGISMCFCRVQSKTIAYTSPSKNNGITTLGGCSFSFFSLSFLTLLQINKSLIFWLHYLNKLHFFQLK